MSKKIILMITLGQRMVKEGSLMRKMMKGMLHSNRLVLHAPPKVRTLRLVLVIAIGGFIDNETPIASGSWTQQHRSWNASTRPYLYFSEVCILKVTRSLSHILSDMTPAAE